MTKITFIGAGNVATHLAKAFFKSGFQIVQVYSRTLETARDLACKVDAAHTNDVKEISEEADVYIVALKDSVIEDVLKGIDFDNSLLVHCSGSLPLSILKDYSQNTGVLYPLQTFSKKRELDVDHIPVFVESSKKSNEIKLLELASEISGNVSVLDSVKRKSLHIAAVLTCNFTNHMYALAAEYLNSKAIPFEVLKPLIEETASKVMEMEPKDAQTGPAVRFDQNIIGEHLTELNEFPGTRELYKSISKSIFEFHKEKNK